jgi:hypothetical protein
MIYFCSEFWMHTGRGIIAGVGHPISAEVYHVTGNKRVRLRRIIEWEKMYEQTYHQSLQIQSQTIRHPR